MRQSMAERESSEPSSNLFSLNSVMAIVTLVGGIILASHKLTSDRPQKNSVEGTQPLGNQNVESRLWEDPFAVWDKLSKQEQQARTTPDLTNLVEVLTNDLIFPSN